MQKCNACGGTYEPVSADGVPYFHVCPPSSVADVRAAIKAGHSPLTPGQTKQLAAFDAIPPPHPTPPDYVPPGDVYLQSINVARPQARNENIDPVKWRAAKKDAAGNLDPSVPPDAIIASVGAGTAPVDDAAVQS